MTQVHKGALRNSIIYFFLYWPLAILGGIYSSGLTWGVADRSVLQSVLMYFFATFYIIPNTLLGNALLGSLVIYSLTFLAIKLKKK